MRNAWDDLRITEWVYIIPLCGYCARGVSPDRLASVFAEMDEDQLRDELGLDDDDEIPESVDCFECGSKIGFDEGFSVTGVSAGYVHDHGVAKASKGRRVRQALRTYVRERDRRTCQVCRCVLRLDECTMHHVAAASRGGETSAENLVVTCAGCNQLIGDREPPRVRIINSEFVRELSAGEMELIYELTHTEEQHEDDIKRILALFQRHPSGESDENDLAASG